MEKKNLLPFGYHYDGFSVTIKLRFKMDKFEKLNIKDFGSCRPTKTGGHVIFYAELDTRSEQFACLTNILRASH